MRSALRGIAIGLVLLALLGAIATRLGWIDTSVPRPEGAGPWMVVRASGLLAYLVASSEVIVGLLISTRGADRLVPRAHLVDLHTWLSPLALALIVAHGAALLADGYLRFDLVDTIVPFASRRWPFEIGLGLLGAYLMLVVHLSFGLRKRIGPAMWRRLHYLSFAVFLLVTVHALAAGTDRGNPWFATIYVVIALTVAVLLAVRIGRAIEARGGSLTSSPPRGSR